MYVHWVAMRLFHKGIKELLVGVAVDLFEDFSYFQNNSAMSSLVVLWTMSFLTACFAVDHFFGQKAKIPNFVIFLMDDV